MPSPPSPPDESSAGAAADEATATALRHILILRADPSEDAAASARSARRYRGLLRRDFPIEESDCHVVADEEAVLSTTARVVRELDADLLMGWDVRQASIGFLIERATMLGLEPPLLRQLGRTPDHRFMNETQEDAWGALVASGIKIVGRVLINLWRCASCSHAPQ